MQHNIELSSESYSESVVSLLKLAHGDTGGSRVAAQVLLSAYNDTNYLLSIPSLGNLDNANYLNAMNVIHGRRCLMKEPHRCVENGGEIFADLCKRWDRLSNKNRFRLLCSKCDGDGCSI